MMSGAWQPSGGIRQYVSGIQSVGEEEPWLSREALVEAEHEARLRDYEDWPKRLEKICREAELRYWAARPWLSSAGAHGTPGWCVSVPVPQSAISDPGLSENPGQ